MNEECKKYISAKLELLRSIFAKASVGDFSENVPMPAKEDEFTEFFSGMQVMIEVIREKTDDYKKLADELDKKINERTAELKLSEEKFKSLTDNAPSMFFTVNRDHKITYMNKVVAGLDLAQVIGSSVYDYIPPEYQAVEREAYEHVFKTGEPQVIELRAIGPDGTIAWYQNNIGPIKKDGVIDSLITITTDITKIKTLEENLKERNKELEKLNKFMIGREARMTELKEEIKSLKKSLSAEH